MEFFLVTLVYPEIMYKNSQINPSIIFWKYRRFKIRNIAKHVLSLRRLEAN